MSNVETWDAAARRYLQEYTPPGGDVPYGPGLPTDATLRLLPSALSGKRVLELGCGAGAAAAAFAAKGARVIGVDSSAEMLAATKAKAEAGDVRVDLHRCDLWELAFVTAESIDVVFCTATLDYVEDLGRVLRSVHRVLKVGGVVVFTVEHPQAIAALDPARPYGDPAPLKVDRYGETFLLYPRTFAEVVNGVAKAALQTEALVEAGGPGGVTTAIWKARKER